MHTRGLTPKGRWAKRSTAGAPAKAFRDKRVRIMPACPVPVQHPRGDDGEIARPHPNTRDFIRLAGCPDDHISRRVEAHDLIQHRPCVGQLAEGLRAVRHSCYGFLGDPLLHLRHLVSRYTDQHRATAVVSCPARIIVAI